MRISPARDSCDLKSRATFRSTVYKSAAIKSFRTSLWRDLPDRAAAARTCSTGSSAGGTVKIAGGVQCYATDGIRSILTTRKIVQIRIGPGAIVVRELEDRAELECAATI